MSAKPSYLNSESKIEERLDDLMKRLTLKEKIKLSHGKLIFWTNRIKRLKLPSMKLTDGPHGIGSGAFLLKEMTYYPVAICRAATWDPELSYKFGESIAEEARAIGRHMVLAPGVNIMRTPLCGRNFEYQSEDPFLNSKMAVEFIKGIQSKRISACVKHFVANNQEYNRFRVSSEISERALQEIYYPAFKASIEEADVWSLMTCYNKVNGIHGSEHYKLVRETLMNKWGFKGFVVSDWFATRYTDTKKCIKAGLTLEMPFAISYRKKKMKNALKTDEELIKIFDDNIRRYLRVAFLVGLLDDTDKIPPGARNTTEHQELALRIAEEGIVLLKNQDQILPIDNEKVKKLALIGPNLKKKHARGGGSSVVRTKYEITPLTGIKSKCKERNIKITKSLPKADAIIIFVGLKHSKHMDRENTDREILDLPKEQENLINESIKLNKKIIVAIVAGCPIGMKNWIDKVPGVLMMWYAGMEGGNAIANILFGDVNPSGKLPITFPKTLQDSPAHKSFKTYPGLKDWSLIQEGDIKSLKSNKGLCIKSDHRDRVFYDEDIFVGYRYYDSFRIDPQFPFGYGLSYTDFKFSNLRIDRIHVTGKEQISIEFDLENAGNRSGSEVAQLYVQDLECTVKRPLKELKAFKKIILNAGEKKKVQFFLEPKDLSFFDEETNEWKLEVGDFNILIGNSSKNILLQGNISYK